MELYRIPGEKAKKLKYTIGGLGAYVVMSGSGDISAPMGRYGPEMDFGGIWTRIYRFSGPIIFWLDGKRLTETVSLAAYNIWGLEIKHGDLVQKVFPAVREPVVFVEFQGSGMIRGKGISWLAPNAAMALLPIELRLHETRRCVGISDGKYSPGVTINRGDIRLTEDAKGFPSKIPEYGFVVFEFEAEAPCAICFAAIKGRAKRQHL